MKTSANSPSLKLQNLSSTPFHDYIFLFVIVVSLVVTLSSGLALYLTREELIATQTRAIQFQVGKSDIGRLDEALTMSARLFASTGDPKWKQRYFELEPLLDKTIKNLAVEFPETPSVHVTDEANQKLLSLEAQSFEMVTRGDRKQAQKLLEGQDYEENKRIYAEGMEAAARTVETLLGDRTTSLKAKSKAVAVALVVLILITIGTWFGLMFRVRGAYRSLAALGNDLDRMVKERTSQLAESQEIAKIGSWRFDLATHALEWSEEQYRIFELDSSLPADALYHAYRSRIHPEDIGKLDRVVERAV